MNGIISQSEFRESIRNINSKISYQKSKILLLVFIGLCLIGGFLLVLVGGVATTSSRQYNSIILIGTGGGLLGFAPILFSTGWFVIRMRRTTKMRKAIGEESKKYSTRSPTSCTWQLNVGTIWTGYRRHHHVLYFYHVSSTVTSYISYKLLGSEKDYRENELYIFLICSFVASILFISGDNYYSPYCCIKQNCKRT